MYGEYRKPAFAWDIDRSPYLEASRHYNNAETGSNEMLRLLH
jgi:hypothetical protein